MRVELDSNFILSTRLRFDWFCFSKLTIINTFVTNQQ